MKPTLPSRQSPCLPPRQPPRLQSLLPTLTLAAAALGAPLAQAASDGQIGRADLNAPGALVSVCGGLAAILQPDAGSVGSFGAHQCRHDTAGPGGTALADGSFVSPPDIATATQGEAGLGWARAAADFAGLNRIFGPAATATVGWEDQVTISAPGLGGQPGQLEFRVLVQAHLEAAPIGNVSASLRVQGYGLAGSSGSWVQWAGQGQFGFPYTQNVDTLATLTVPFVFGAPFELGVYARALGNTASWAPSASWPETHSQVDLLDLHWDGITAVMAGGAPVSGWSMDAASGIDWTNAVLPPSPVPEPASWLLLLAGTACTLRRAAGRQQAR